MTLGGTGAALGRLEDKNMIRIERGDSGTVNRYSVVGTVPDTGTLFDITPKEKRTTARTPPYQCADATVPLRGLNRQRRDQDKRKSARQGRAHTRKPKPKPTKPKAKSTKANVGQLVKLWFDQHKARLGENPVQGGKQIGGMFREPTNQLGHDELAKRIKRWFEDTQRPNYTIKFFLTWLQTPEAQGKRPTRRAKHLTPAPSGTKYKPAGDFSQCVPGEPPP